ncbi:hypothetical protein NF705_03820 [Lactococcus formosensis]|uniref:hypothetical protein n=1 Tax=Lactococcus formosensis TaxID=1281486 RepID=UPI002434BF1B|nr:hypothetical protein [Lactococcus formosensis]MDG6159676.1 hypothetical protein [Lactococcus formosensis]
MNVKRVLDLIVDGNIVSISHKGNKNIIFQGIKGADSFEEYNNFEGSVAKFSKKSILV